MGFVVCLFSLKTNQHLVSLLTVGTENMLESFAKLIYIQWQNGDAHVVDRREHLSLQNYRFLKCIYEQYLPKLSTAAIVMSGLESYMNQKYGTKDRKRQREQKKVVEDEKELENKAHKSQLDDIKDKDTSVEKTLKKPKVKDTAGKSLSTNIETAKEIVIDSQTVKESTQDDEHASKEDIKHAHTIRGKRKTGGIQTSEQLAAEIKKREEKRLKELNELVSKNSSKTQQVIYRDKTGRKLTESEVKQIHETKKPKDHEDINSLDQRTIANLENERLKLEKVKNEGLNIYENDPKLLNSLKSEIKSEDPALMFDKKIIEKHKKDTESKLVSTTGRKLYEHINQYPYNRYGIAPGWRWDGVVRGNGYEANLLKQKLNKNK